MPRVTLARRLERKLGIPPGRTLTALAARAFAKYQREPWLTFDPLDLDLHWLRSAVSPTREYRPGLRPRGVVPFTSTTISRPTFGAVDPYFAFLMHDPALPTDDRPIVVVHPSDARRPARVIAPNLRDFLGLVAHAGARWIRREWTRAQWRKAHFDLEDTFEGGDAMRSFRAARKTLVSIPGVKVPDDPLRITRASPDVKLAYDPAQPLPRAAFERVAVTPSLYLDDARAAFDAGHVDIADRAARALAKDPLHRPDAYDLMLDVLMTRPSSPLRTKRVHALACAWIDDALFARAERWRKLAAALEACGVDDPKLTTTIDELARRPDDSF